MNLMAIEYGVRQLHAGNVDATWRKDEDEFVGCFTEDAEWRFARRYWSMMHASDAVTAGPMEVFGDFGAFPGMPAVDLPPPAAGAQGVRLKGERK